MIVFSDGTVINHSFDYMSDPNCPTYTIKEIKQMSQIKLVAVAVYDSKVKQYTTPSFVRTTEEGIRSFQAAAQQENHDFKKFASDYSLWQLGYYYPETGGLEKIERVQIASATDF